MRVTVGPKTESGRVVDLRAERVDGRRLAAAIEGEETETGDGRQLSVACLEPGPVHERVGYVHPEMGLRVRTALAAAARSRGLSAPQDERLWAISRELAALDPPDEAPTEAARRRRAAVEGDVERVRERVATLRGRLAAAREAGRETDDIEAELRAATRELSEVETEALAAEEALERAREHASAVRDRRERRRRLEDERANLARAARAHLVDELREAFAAAVATAPGSDDPDDPFDAVPVTAALAVCRVASLHAPVVLACDRFSDPRRAATWLDAPVIRV